MTNARKSGQRFPRVGVSGVSGAPLHRSGCRHEWLLAELSRGPHLKGAQAEFSQRTPHWGEAELMRENPKTSDALYNMH